MGSYAFRQHTAAVGTQQAELKREEERRAAETEANRKVAEAEQQRLAALKAVEQERQTRAAAEAEVKRIREQAEQDEERRAKAAAEAEEKRKAEQRGLFTIQGVWKLRGFAALAQPIKG